MATDRMAQELITINQRYKSSTRIDSEAHDYQEFVDSFIVHGTAINVLDTISRDISGSAQRTYTLTGPYGSGKSTIALFLSSLLSKNVDERQYAQSKLNQHSEALKDFQSRLNVKKGWHIVKHVCGLESPAHSILVSVSESLSIEYDVKQIAQLNDEECLEQIKSAFTFNAKQHDGIVVLLDEMGKALDFQSRANKDLHLFQSLADICQQSSTPVVLIGFLHQAFIDYAKNKDTKAQQEWAKVQGRYRDLSFNPSIDESLVLVGDSIKKDEATATTLEDNYSSLVENVACHFSNQNRNVRALIKTLPIDPLVSLLLGPISRRRFSQNERSLFGFLASHEKYGFREFLSENYSESVSTNALYSPEQFWDYLHHNLHHLIVTSHDSKAWLEGCDAIHRASQKGTDLHDSITKVIALLTIFGFHHHLHASKEFLVAYFKARGVSVNEIKKAIDDLEAWSVVIFRNKHNALFIFQGSDVDIHNLILEKIESISDGVDWTSVCDMPQNILATAHYHQTGTMRWAKTQLVSKVDAAFINAFKNEPTSSESFLTFLMPIDSTIEKALKDSEITEEKHIAIAGFKSVNNLKEAAIELIALQKVTKEEVKIKHDLIAQKELETRIITASRNVESELNKLFAFADWEHQGNPVRQSSLSFATSSIADTVFNLNHKEYGIKGLPLKSEEKLHLKVINELVNRTKPSGSANSAIRKLMNAMLNDGDEEDLGFDNDSFPPEKGVYLSCLKNKGWHCKTDEGFGFPGAWSDEEQKRNPDMYALWLDGFNFIKDSNTMVTIADLYDRWMKPPFGLTTGLCRLYALALLKSLEGKIAFYDYDSSQQFIFIPELDEELVNKIYKHPKEAGVRYFEMSEIQTHLLSTLAQATIGSLKNNDDILGIAKHIVRIVHGLPAWVKKTSGESFTDNGQKSGLTREAKAFRNKVIAANDPYKLILEDLPAIFDISKDQDDADSKLASRLKTAIEDLSAQHDMLLTGFKELIKANLSAEFDEELKARCERVAKAAQRPNVKELALRLIKFIENKAKFEQIINLAAGTPERNWTDKHLRNGFDELLNLCVQFRRIESFSNFENNSGSKPLAFITTDSKGNYKEYSAYMKLSSESEQRVTNKIEELKKELATMSKDEKLNVATNLLTELMDETGGTESNDR
ncbi:ATP-binding protein [Parashewanella tropica]|uniref:ATP-binding protein n=1 Tax=Parashewanella tropica TaxID=2547970 RepID=UPI001FE98618|nr:ATP-binding protein [Parashewanella tropica]